MFSFSPFSSTARLQRHVFNGTSSTARLQRHVFNGTSSTARLQRRRGVHNARHRQAEQRMMKQKAFLVLPFVFLFARCALSQSSTQAAQTSAALTAGSSISWDVARQDKRITALAQDKRGRIFAASEESGVWMRGTSRHSDHLWRRFTAKNSKLADDNIYALTVDQQNRVWAGTASHGVSVFNGRYWKNYDVLQAPIGERIFDIAVCPIDGDVWIASNIGLTRYSVAKDLWQTNYSSPQLSFNHIQALALVLGFDGL